MGGGHVYPMPNPLAALQNAISPTTPLPRAPINTTPVMTEPMVQSGPVQGYDPQWDGLHCPFAYGFETLTGFPAVPTFMYEKGEDDCAD